MLDLTKESSLLNPIKGYIARKGFRVHGTELPFYQRSVDVYGFSKTNHIVSSITELLLLRTSASHK